jgi:hypothetical protein
LEVHHGKTFILLSLCLKEKELGIAVDIFDNQELNVDFSGKGDLELFRRNLLKHGNETQSKIIKKSSMSLKPDDIKQSLRFIHVDGGHWYGAVVNDLRLAAACAGPDCVIAIDDFFNADFPEIAAAYYTWKEEKSELVPFSISRGKLYICHAGYQEYYRGALANNNYLHLNTKKTTQHLGNSVLVITGRHSGIRGFASHYTKLYAPALYEFIKSRLAN